MSFFQQASSNATKLSDQLLGPPYNYKSKVKTPAEIGMSDKGTLDALGKDVGGLIGYAEILITGGGVASKVDGPLGNKFFLKTGSQCKDEKSGKEVDRYIYINNVPGEPLPGLIKGTTTGVDALNPFRLMGAFAQGTAPKCRQITLEVVDNNNNKRRETHYMTLNDIDYVRSGFANMIVKGEMKKANEGEITNDEVGLPDDPYIQAYLVFLATFGVFVIYKLMGKK